VGFVLLSWVGWGSVNFAVDAVRFDIRSDSLDWAGTVDGWAYAALDLISWDSHCSHAVRALDQQ